jgi:hypothetical protein
MNAQRKKQIAWWAMKIGEQATEYADIVDPKRAQTNRIANKLDTIRRLADEIYSGLTWKERS